LIKAGTLPENNRLDIDAQIATSEQTLVGNQNNVDIAYLNIKQLLQLEPNTPFVLEKPVIELTTGDQLNAVAL
jgi:outer membrane protein